MCQLLEYFVSIILDSHYHKPVTTNFTDEKKGLDVIYFVASQTALSDTASIKIHDLCAFEPKTVLKD